VIGAPLAPAVNEPKAGRVFTRDRLFGRQTAAETRVPARPREDAIERAATRQKRAEQRASEATQRVSEQRAADERSAAKILRLRALRLARDEAAAREEADKKPEPARPARKTSKAKPKP
jgi:hypothetical protein